MDLLRLAIPRRVYTQSHLDYVADVAIGVWKRRDRIRGLELSFQTARLRHFTARFRKEVDLKHSAVSVGCEPR
jgi:tyrosine phenol-lyase